MGKIVAKFSEGAKKILGNAFGYVFKVGAVLLPSPTIEEQVYNNSKVQSVDMVDGNIVIVAPLAELEAYPSTVASQGTHKWIGLEVKTGFDSLIGIKYGDYAFTEEDVEEAAVTGCEEGSFVLYIKAEEVVEEHKAFILSKEGCVECPVEVIVEDSGN